MIRFFTAIKYIFIDLRMDKLFTIGQLIGRWLVRILVAYAVICSLAITIGLVAAYRYVMAPINEIKALAASNPVESAYMAAYREDLRRQNKPDTLTHLFVPLDSISKNLQNAVIAAEDDGFWVHPGFNIDAMVRAYAYNVQSGKIKRGGSTITQQLVKNLFLDTDKNFERKYKEMAYTLLVEKFLGKKRILELYLNYAQWGPSLFGCEAAAQLYFKKPASQLSRYEAIRMAALLASPERKNPFYEKSTFLSSRIQVIANNLYIHHIIDDTGYRNITGAPPPNDSTHADSSQAQTDTSSIE
ncbi:MAG: monofunctional biosynthetic peptidoglycan transglycosylase [Candidatus Raymondbacteria bacterium RifOxyC12_full_50_8]|uniref:Monofunctional biosynthetic peptidoglycan transglycosylase n=1 Tax=Candidatus Raymondbacteria bacterium RIFOXYD12_FULL_49_13 TaxID=1817890 RepID=A0A1F7FBV3_UNCRA|nr:MAG: monofunctional biosynthetic peptidoglycan transglycosylase [Candidatus Raymondbacteria bacterium RifOxyC12_full_50_8]OGK04002.1 MAG: monofunctional biosynthetic peptidoglycan transglycosylase [Candidatus Raymondbacteria bacterium RIFOXYD12_FULL_49_13]